MDVRKTAIAISLGRAALGGALVLAPAKVATAWVGSTGAEPAAQALARAVGIRDLAIGTGAALAVLGEDDAAATWLSAAALCDLGDVAATLAARDALPAAGVQGTVALAGVAAVVGAWASLALRS